jgi:hypothetical protein
MALRAKPTDWARILFFQGVWLFSLWILIIGVMRGASLGKVMLLVLALVLFGLMIYRDVTSTFSSGAGSQHPPDDLERVRETLVASAQSNESWVCTHCGEPTPLDYAACVHCGRPAGRLR